MKVGGVDSSNCRACVFLPLGLKGTEFNKDLDTVKRTAHVPVPVCPLLHLPRFRPRRASANKPTQGNKSTPLQTQATNTVVGQHSPPILEGNFQRTIKRAPFNRFGGSVIPR